MKKKGVAISLNLLIIFALLIFAVVLFVFVIPKFHEELEREGTASTKCTKWNCDFDLKHVCLVANEVQLTLENTKDSDIAAFNVRVYGSKDTDEIITPEGVTSFAMKKIYTQYDLSKTGPVRKLAIFPILRTGEQTIECPDNFYKVEDVAYCTTGCITCTTKVPICKTAHLQGLCDGLDTLYGIGCQEACCVEHGLCCD